MLLASLFAALALAKTAPMLFASPPSQKTGAISQPAALTMPPAPTMTLRFKEFFEPGDKELKPTAKLLQCNGRHVSIAGFMAQMEAPLKGAFYLCPRPVFCDEEGAGTADLPPETVRVIVRSAKRRAIPFLPRPLLVTGILSVRPKNEEDGVVSMIRLVLDRPSNVRKREPTSRPVPAKSSAHERKRSL